MSNPGRSIANRASCLNKLPNGLARSERTLATHCGRQGCAPSAHLRSASAFIMFPRPARKSPSCWAVSGSGKGIRNSEAPVFSSRARSGTMPLGGPASFAGCWNVCANFPKSSPPHHRLNGLVEPHARIPRRQPQIPRATDRRHQNMRRLHEDCWDIRPPVETGPGAAGHTEDRLRNMAGGILPGRPAVRRVWVPAWPEAIQCVCRSPACSRQSPKRPVRRPSSTGGNRAGFPQRLIPSARPCGEDRLS